MLQRTSLSSGEYGRVNELRHHLGLALGSLAATGILKVLTQQDDTAAGSAQCLVGC